MDNFYIITGGPGSGKSTLLEALSAEGFFTVEEAGRLIIQHEVKVNGDALPWKNLALFKMKMLDHAIETYDKAPRKGLVFFDRGVVDLIGYDRLTNTGHTPELIKAVDTLKYNKTVFIAPPWEEIYCNDVERKQTFNEAIATYENISQAYKDYGYELVELPKVKVAERVKFIKENCSLN